MGSADLVPSLQTGLIEGGVSAVLFHYFVTRRYASHLTLSRHSYDTGAIVANKAWFDGATQQQRDLLRDAWGDSAEARAAVRSLAEGAIRQMRTKGIQVRALSEPELRAWRQATRDVATQLIARIGGAAQQVHEAIQAGKRAFAERSASRVQPPIPVARGQGASPQSAEIVRAGARRPGLAQRRDFGSGAGRP